MRVAARGRSDDKPSAATGRPVDEDDFRKNAPVPTDAKRRPGRGYDPAMGQTLKKVFLI
jgi:hypothetical protein